MDLGKDYNNYMLINILNKLYKTCPKGEFFIVGGTSRDFLLNRNISDIDVATTLTPDELKEFFKDGDYTFAKFGTINIKIDGQRITLATMRKEELYRDYRHPDSVEFVKDYEIDARRRDFTINAIYFCHDGTILDPLNGLDDLNLGLIRMIGDVDTRITEDPLRILRAIRFSLNLDFMIEEYLDKYINSHGYLIKRLNKAKIEEEINKTNIDKRELFKNKIEKMIND